MKKFLNSATKTVLSEVVIFQQMQPLTSPLTDIKNYKSKIRK